MPRPSKAKASPILKARAITPRDWNDIEELFGPKGACVGCWCMFWRLEKGAWSKGKGASNRAAFKTLITEGTAPGVLAYVDDEPVGWCSIAPKEQFGYFKRSRVLDVKSPPGTWSVNCFFIKSPWRGKGVATALLGKAVVLAKRRGASAVEGYPVAIPASGKIANTFAWTGLPSLFAKVGFKKLRRPGKARPIYRLEF